VAGTTSPPRPARRPASPGRFIPRLEHLEDRTAPAASGVGAFDPATATWFLRNTPTPGAPDAGQFQYGPPGSIAVVGDWNGDGRDDIGVVVPSSMVWLLHFGTSGGLPDAGVFQYGGPGSIPVVGDWDGDRDSDVGVLNPNFSVWQLHFGLGGGFPDAGVFQYGPPGVSPAVGVYAAPFIGPLFVPAFPPFFA
jgi:hypothetical protein